MISGRQQSGSRRSSSTIVKIAVGGIAIGMAVMILSVAIVKGFQTEIQQKVIGFGSHLQITRYNPASTMGAKPMDMSQEFLIPLGKEPTVQSIQAFAIKSGILTANDEIKGIVAKGVSTDFDWTFFKQNLVEGSVFRISENGKSDSIIISKYICDKLKLSLGNKVTVVFIQDEKERKRRFIIGGIYESGMEQFDANIMLCDMQHVQKLNNWTDQQVAGFEVTFKSFEDLEHIDDIVSKHIPWDFTSTSITEQFMEIFGWLELQDLNVIIILTLMVLVSGINMITALLVFILERTNMIGLLKAMGANNSSLSRIFLYNAAYLIVLGTFWGNVFGIGLGWLQNQFELLKLDKSSYYIDHVPVLFDVNTILYINIGSIIISLIMLILPSMMVSRIAPIQSIRFN